MKSFPLMAQVQLFASIRHATIFSISNNSNYRYCLFISVARHFPFASYSGNCASPALSSLHVSLFYCKQFTTAHLSFPPLTAPATSALPAISSSSWRVSIANNSSSMCIVLTLSPSRVSLFLTHYADYCALPAISSSPSHHCPPLKTTLATCTRGQP